MTPEIKCLFLSRNRVLNFQTIIQKRPKKERQLSHSLREITIFLAMGALALTFLACLSSSSLMSTEDEVHPESLSQNLLSTD